MESVDDFVAGLGAFWDAAMTPAGLVIIAAGVALMGQSKGMYTFASHLKWTWAVALGYAASILCHLFLNASSF